ncbi:MAG: 6-bladed beta-propeller [Bacteroidales bacterium]|nr:6-bladed beta-propeller [Bacteroidales bacterium]MBO7567790.1 6-bladed beta-propeller [Bacteroidales bacterium]MBP5682112.1 6-bladed beta-propeller [Bacteroidales bacterium]
MRNTIICALVIILAIGCKQQPDYIVIESKSDNCKVLNLDPVFEPIPWDTTTISDIVDTMKIVALETSPESILAGIGPIKIYGNRIVNRDMNEGIAIFDINGKYIKHIRRGQGPGEINASFDFDADSQYLYILQQDKISKFTLDGEFVDNYPLPEKYMTNPDNIKKVDDGFLLSLRPYSDEMSYEVFHLDENLNEKNHFVFEHSLHYGGQSGFMMTDGRIVFYMPMTNTIYQFDGKTFSPYLVFNYPKFANTFENYSGVTDPRDFSKKYCIPGKYFFSGQMCQASNILYISFWDNFPPIQIKNAYVDTQNGKFRIQGHPSDRDKPYENLLYYCGGVGCSYNDYMVRYISPECYLTEPKISEELLSQMKEDLKEHGIDWESGKKEEKDKDWYSKLEHISAEDVLKLKNAKAEDNPLLVFIKFKNIPDGGK